MNNAMNFALGLISQNPQIANNPNAKEMIDVIQSGDFHRGQVIARNLCQANNTTPEEAINVARRFFGF